MTSARSQQGAALLSTLMVVAAMSVTAILALDAVTRSTATAKSAARRANAAWALQSAEALARLGIEDLVTATAGRVTERTPGLDEPVIFPVPGGIMSARLTDASNCFNLNIFAAPVDSADAILIEQTLARFQGVLVDAGIFAGDARALAESLADWIDADSNQRPAGAEDAVYASGRTPYRAANQPLESMGEIGAILGYSPEVIETIAPLVCARRDTRNTVLNINTLRPEQAPLLRAIYSDDLSFAAARRLLEDRPGGGWATISDFESQGALQAIPAERRRSSQVSTMSRYFDVTGTITLDEGRWPFAFTLEAEAGAPAKIVARRLGEP